MNAQELETACRLADGAADPREAADLLRKRFPGLRIAVVDAFDMRDEQHAAQGRVHTLWLGHSDGHCWSITPEPEQADVIFIANQGALS